MKRNPLAARPHLPGYGLVILLVLLGLAAITLLVSSKKVHALPEYTVRTGESCAACHVNPGGGGPRTLRGLLWSARGRPDAVPDLPGILLAPGVTDPVELYEIGCAGCHGYRAEGLSTLGLANTRISYRTIESFTLNGIPKLGMPGFEGQYTDEQMETLLQYVTGLSSGEIPPPESSFPLPPALFRCNSAAPGPLCGGTSPEAGGN
jgi:mono/diheme cytochrome c family protein